jgi:hypothetical protein
LSILDAQANQEYEMFLQQGPADTVSFMIMGFTMILGTMAVYIISLIVRMQSLRKDQAVLDEIDD